MPGPVTRIALSGTIERIMPQEAPAGLTTRVTDASHPSEAFLPTADRLGGAL